MRILTISILEGVNNGVTVIESMLIFLMRPIGKSGGRPPPTPEVTKISPTCSSANKGVNNNFNSWLLVPAKMPRSRLFCDTTGILELMSVISVTRAYLPLIKSMRPIRPSWLTTAEPFLISSALSKPLPAAISICDLLWSHIQSCAWHVWD